MRTWLAVTAVLLLVGTGVGQERPDFKVSAADAIGKECPKGQRWVKGNYVDDSCPPHGGFCSLSWSGTQKYEDFDYWHCVGNVDESEPPAPKAGVCDSAIMCLAPGWSATGLFIDGATKTISGICDPKILDEFPPTPKAKDPWNLPEPVGFACLPPSSVSYVMLPEGASEKELEHACNEKLEPDWRTEIESEPPAPKATFCIGGVLCVPEGWSVDGIWIDDKTKTIRPNPTAPKAEDICLQCSNGGSKDCLSTLARVAPKAGTLVPAITEKVLVHPKGECYGQEFPSGNLVCASEDIHEYRPACNPTDLGPWPDQQTPPQWWCLTTK